jgi:hypothetical protein
MLLIIVFSTPHYLVPLTPKNITQHPISNTLSLSSSSVTEQLENPYKPQFIYMIRKFKLISTMYIKVKCA